MKTKPLPLPLIFLGCCTALFFSCKKEEIISIDQNLVKQYSITSTFTGSTYPIFVVLPANYNPALKYETLYALDGDDLTPANQKVYDLVGKACQTESANSGKQNVIAVCVSALGQEERFRDYSPVPFMTNSAPTSGGSAKYAQFFKNELIPFIEGQYNVDTTRHSRTICGHSLGGTFAGFMFAKHPNVFENYILLSPALYWGDGVVMEYEETARNSLSTQKGQVFTACGEYEEGIKIFAREWNYRMSNYYPDYKTQYHEEKGTGHIGSAAENIRQGIGFYFKNK